MNDLFQRQIIRTKIMPPLGNTMRFIDNQQFHISRFENVEKRAASKSLRRNVNQFETTVLDRLQAVALFRQHHGTVDKSDLG